MSKKMTWEEMKQAYPDEFVRVIDCELDKYGEIKSGTVILHSKNENDMNWPAEIGELREYWFTGIRPAPLGFKGYVLRHGFDGLKK